MADPLGTSPTIELIPAHIRGQLPLLLSPAHERSPRDTDEEPGRNTRRQRKPEQPRGGSKPKQPTRAKAPAHKSPSRGKAPKRHRSAPAGEELLPVGGGALIHVPSLGTLPRSTGGRET